MKTSPLLPVNEKMIMLRCTDKEDDSQERNGGDARISLGRRNRYHPWTGCGWYWEQVESVERAEKYCEEQLEFWGASKGRDASLVQWKFHGIYESTDTEH